MSAITKNIKKIRSVKKISQQAFADLFGVTRASVGSYEEGRAEPKIGLVMDIANKFNISVEELLNKDLTINDVLGFSEREVDASSKQKLNPDGQRHMIPYVSAKNCTTYLNNLDSQEYLPFMPRFELPNFSVEKARAFEIVGNDMWHQNNGLYPGNTLVCTSVSTQKPQLLKELAIHAVVFDDKILIRKLNFGKGKLILKAINPFYEDVEVFLDDVKELWQAKTLIGELNSFTISDEVEELKSTIAKISAELNAFKK